MTDRPAALEAAVAPTARVLARRAAAKRKRQQMDKDARNTARRGERRRRRARDAAAQAEASRLAGGFVGWPGLPNWDALGAAASSVVAAISNSPPAVASAVAAAIAVSAEWSGMDHCAGDTEMMACEASGVSPFDRAPQDL